MSEPDLVWWKWHDVADAYGWSNIHALLGSCQERRCPRVSELLGPWGDPVAVDKLICLARMMTPLLLSPGDEP